MGLTINQHSPGEGTTVTRGHIAAVLTLFVLTPTVGLVLPDIGSIATAFEVSATTATWVATAPSLAMVPVTILTGVFAGRRLRYRPLVLAATALYILSGLLPAVTHPSFEWLLATRVLWGAATGVLLTAANNLLVLTSNNAVLRARRFGLANMVFSVASVASLVIGGQLAAISWSAPLWGHLVGIPALLVLMIWLREPARQIVANPGARARIPHVAYMPMAAFAALVMCVYPVSTLMSVVFKQAALGEPSTVGLVGSLLTLTGLVVAPNFGRLYARLGTHVLPWASLTCAMGLVVIFISTPAGTGSLPMYVAGLIITGAGLVGATISIPVITSTLVPHDAGGTAQGLVASALNVGGLLSSIYAALILPRLGGGVIVRPLYLVSAAIAVAIAVPLWTLGRHHDVLPAVRVASPRRPVEVGSGRLP